MNSKELTSVKGLLAAREELSKKSHTDSVVHREREYVDNALSGYVPALVTEVERLRTALEGVLEVCRDRQAFVMMGPRAFAKAEQIALKALGSSKALEG